MNYYINQYGQKTSKKLEKIIAEACDYVDNTRGSWEFKNNTKKMQKLRDRFNIEVERIGGVDYNFGDCIA
tara:strand:+ start:44 stop:253 length:210 start_codon:yes stop_codon:yes gene_type:complete